MRHKTTEWSVYFSELAFTVVQLQKTDLLCLVEWFNQLFYTLFKHQCNAMHKFKNSFSIHQNVLKVLKILWKTFCFDIPTLLRNLGTEIQLCLWVHLQVYCFYREITFRPISNSLFLFLKHPDHSSQFCNIVLLFVCLPGSFRKGNQ